jgi:hypothetical protein
MERYDDNKYTHIRPKCEIPPTNLLDVELTSDPAI